MFNKFDLEMNKINTIYQRFCGRIGESSYFGILFFRGTG